MVTPLAGARAQTGWRSAASAPQNVASQSGSRLIVHTTANDADEHVIKTLLGEFAEMGANHGRKFYQKVAAKAGDKPPEVFLYFWDNRDGPSFMGWWFGRQVGGNEVWSHCADSSQLPPAKGWKIPFQGPVRSTLQVVPKTEFQKASSDVEAKAVSGQILAACSAATAACEKAKTASFSTLKSLEALEQAVAPHIQTLNDLQKKVADARKGAGALALKEPAQRLNTVQTQLNTLSTKIRTSKAEVTATAKNQEQERQDREAYEAALAQVKEKTNLSEDMVEKAVITYAQVEQTEDKQEAMQVVTDTEKAAQEAQKIITEALGFLATKFGLALKNIKSDKVRKEVAAKMEETRAQLRESAKRLGPLKSARQEFTQRQAAQKATQEIYEKLAPAEVEVDRAEEIGAHLDKDPVSDETVQAVEKVLTEATNQVNVAMRLQEMKARGASGVMKNEMEKVEDRLKKSQKRLDVVRASLKKIQESKAGTMVLQAVKEKMEALAEIVKEAGQTEKPCKPDATPTEILQTVKDAEPILVAANKAMVNARMVLSMKIIEVKRFSEDRGKEVMEQIQKFQSELDGHGQKVTRLKKIISDRKRAAQQREMEHRIVSIEEILSKAVGAATLFADEEILKEAAGSEVRQAADILKKAEAAAKEDIAAVQKTVTQRLVEAKAAEKPEQESEEFVKLQTRLRKLQLEADKYKKLPSGAEKALVVKKLLDAAVGKVSAAEEQVSQVENRAKEFAAAVDTSVEDRKGLEANRDSIEASLASTKVMLKGVVTYLDVHKRSPNADIEEVQGLETRMAAAEERLEAASALAKDSFERLAMKLGLIDGEEHVNKAEKCFTEASEAASKLQPKESNGDTDAVPEGVGMDAVGALDAALSAAHKAVEAANTFITQRKAAVQKLKESLQETVMAQLIALGDRAEKASTKLDELDKSTQEKKYVTAKAAVDHSLKDISTKMEDAKTSLKTLKENTTEGDPAAMQGELEATGTKQQLALSAISAAKSMLKTLLKAKATDESEVIVSLKKSAEALDPMQQEMESEVKALSDFELAFVAGHVSRRANELMAKVETKIEALTSAADPLVSEGKQDLHALECLSRLGAQLQEYMAEEGKTMKEVFDQMSKGTGKVIMADFVTFCQLSLPPFAGTQTRFTEEEFKATFQLIDAKGAGEITAEDLAEIHVRYSCVMKVSITDTLVVKNSNTVRMLEAGEVVEGLGERGRDGEIGLTRIKVRCERDGAEGFVSVRGNQEGTTYLQVICPFTTLTETADKALAEASSAVMEAGQFLKAQAEEMKTATAGPLSEAKNEIAKMRVRVTKHMQANSQLKIKLAGAKKRHEKELQERVLVRKEAEVKTQAAAMMQSANSLVEAVQAEVDKAVSTAEALMDSKGSDEEEPLKAMQEAEAAVKAALSSVEEATNKIMKDNMEELRETAKTPFVEARRLMFRLKVKLGPCEGRCKKVLGLLQGSKDIMASLAFDLVARILRRHLAKKKLEPRGLFTELCTGSQTITWQALRLHLESLAEASLTEEVLGLAAQRCPEQISWLQFAEMCQDFRRCLQPLKLTKGSSSSSDMVRTLDKHEVVEVLLESHRDEESNLERRRCRAVRDCAEGWVDIKASTGARQLELAPKPYMKCEVDMELASDGDSMSLSAGSLLEVLEGPRREEGEEVQRMKGKCSKDGKIGWVTLATASGVANFEAKPLLVCKGSIALTDAFDIGECNAVRKIEQGEILEKLEEEKEDEKRKLVRVKVRGSKDGKEGWTTMRGNAGTSYVAESDSHYVCLRSVALESDVVDGFCQEIRKIAEGELFEVREGPKAEVCYGPSKVRCKCFTGAHRGKEGWISLSKKATSDWTCRVKCTRAVDLFEEAEKGKKLRALGAGELLDLLDLPMTKEGVDWASVRAEKDGAVGFVLLGSAAAPSLQPMQSRT